MLASKGQVPVYEHWFLRISGGGTWTFVHPTPPYYGTDSDEVMGGHMVFTVILSIGGIEGSGVCIQKLSHQPLCSAPSG